VKTAGDLTEIGRVVGYLELDGLAGPAVCAEAIRIGADLVVMATHGRGAAGRFWHGSVADYVVRHLTVPVLLVHPGGANARFADSALRGVLVALDLSADSEAILQPAAELARLTQAPLTLMHVVVEPVFEMGRYTVPTALPPACASAETRRAETLDRLDRLAGPLRARGLRVATRVTVSINPAWALQDVFRSSQFDVLAMTTHGAGGLRRILMGSVADKIVRDATKSVLVLRPHANAPTPGEQP
jgi:nucleotide-binding universal stress UspA family protein